MRRIRVLVVDDAVVVRRMVTDVLAADPQIEVVGVAANGRIALQKIVQLTPDLLTLDVEMPEMDGLQTIVEIRKTWATLPVIMFSTLTERGGQATLDALTLGATDYVTKPANVGSVSIAQQRIRDELIPKIKTLCAGVLASAPAPAPASAPASAPAPARAPAPAGGAARASTPSTARATTVTAGPVKLSTGASPFAPQIVAIGTSTGGPNALLEVIPKLPAQFPVPVVITQHMPPMFTRLLAERLSTHSRNPVREAAEGDVILPGTVWVAPGDHHLVLQRQNDQVVATLSKAPPENSCRPAVDVMLRSVVDCFGGRVLSVILTGMGQDGLRGSELVHDAGGMVLAQDEASSVVWGMPGFVARAGIANAVLPIADVAAAIVSRVLQTPSVPRSAALATPPAGSVAGTSSDSSLVRPGVTWR
jgi:two-component system chemotaxis response regulator CheB